MTQHLPPLDEAELTAEFRRVYRDIGYKGCMEVLYELLVSAEILCKVMREEEYGQKEKT